MSPTPDEIRERNNAVHLWTWGIVWVLVAAVWIFGPISIWDAWSDPGRTTRSQVFATIGAAWNMLMIPIAGFAFAFYVTRKP